MAKFNIVVKFNMDIEAGTQEEAIREAVRHFDGPTYQTGLNPQHVNVSSTRLKEKTQTQPTTENVDTQQEIPETVTILT